MFKCAIPVFAEGKEREMNYQLVLRAETGTLRDTVLYITAFSFYRLCVDGQFVAFGPARTAGGYARVDALPLDAYDRDECVHELTVEVAGYYCNSISTVKQPSFVCAELRRGEEVLLATGRDFEGFCSCRRLQKAERFSMQRHFGEIWDFTEPNPFADAYRVRLVAAENQPIYLPRRVSYPTYEMTMAEKVASFGRFHYDENRPCRQNRYSGNTMSPQWGQYYEPDTVSLPFRWIQKQQTVESATELSFPLTLHAGEYAVVDLGKIWAGFLTWSASVHEACEVVLGYSELCDPHDFAFTNINMQTVIEYRLPEGKQVDTMSFEPYTCRVAILMVRGGSLTLESFGLRAFELDRSHLIRRRVQDPDLQTIYEAAERTFAHNAVDLYTDCPSRERAGWLCDTFFTGRAEYFLTGKTTVEDAFLENYRLYRKVGDLPDGVLPMCYPSDEHDQSKFIPQWNMWYVLEVKEYLTERNPSADRELFRDSVYGIVRFLEPYENGDGLLQNLPSWNFVEWSTANEWVQDVNYPTNFLYAEVLRATYALYGDEALLEKADRVARKTAALSFDGEVFVDNAALDENGVLKNTRNISEAGQYYAILFGGIDLKNEKYAALKSYVDCNFADFEPGERSFVPVNAFIGLYLRICALMMLGEKEILKQDLKDFFGGMVASTGTLWEYKERKGSHDHGFASLAAIAIDFVEN